MERYQRTAELVTTFRFSPPMVDTDFNLLRIDLIEVAASGAIVATHDVDVGALQEEWEAFRAKLQICAAECLSRMEGSVVAMAETE